MTSSAAPSHPRPDGPRAPSDTIVVTGGTGPSAVDAAQVRLAAARMEGVADSLRRAAGLAGTAWADVAGGSVAVEPGTLASASAGAGLGAAGLESEAARRAVCASLEAATSGLRRCAAAFDLLGWRLLRVAGLYDEAEGLAERLVGGLVTAEGFAIGTAVGVPPVRRLLASAYRALGSLAVLNESARAVGRPVVPGSAAAFHVAGTHRAGGRRPPGERGDAPAGGAEERAVEDGRRAAGGLGGVVVRDGARWTDELAYGFGHGVAWSAGTGHGVPGGAGALADAVRDVPVGTLGRSVRLERSRPEEFAGGLPAWRDQGAGTVGEALSRIDDLYPRSGAPQATVAVQRTVGADGTTSWLVLVPGTQSATPAAHPWDGLSDLELVAGRPDQATEAVEAAMSAAGIGPHEPVVLVGHSLGGIVVTALAGSPAVAERYRIGGVVTAGAPVATFRTLPGTPVLHLETAEEVVSGTDGRSSTENPRAPDRVTIGRVLGASPAGVDQAAARDASRAHSIPTHARTLALAREAGDPRVAAVVDRIEPLLRAERAETVFYRAERVVGGVSSGASTGREGSP
ncbi:alpha/beta fold hydrolase [Myceligenerans indicum]|uniref:PGAP1-like protein n=1 Tax=Myceligenerans indicum TaxID=2593663 RepID=A0ABS1LIU1_9MICO|nr:hypothetical protein [Myceligenerans indicum]MBL0886069.1 hypothetical protein [Myceligenerans indicum]